MTRRKPSEDGPDVVLELAELDRRLHKKIYDDLADE